MTAEAVEVRRADAADRDAIVSLAARSLGWVDDERDRAFFAWKHDDNPAGPSPMWIAHSDGQVVGVRAFMRWDLRDGSRRVRAVRAVDTATDPAHQGRGIFRRLTLRAVDELVTEGVDCIFNTPNDQSRPGYLKMGWSVVGRPSIGVVVRSPSAAWRMVRSRTGADKWSEPTDVGHAASEVLADSSALAGMGPAEADGRLSTHRSGDHLRWRYGFEPLCYRAIEVRGGWCVFRVRRRGAAREVAICEWLSDEPDARAIARLVRRAGDYAVGIGLGLRSHGAVTLPRQGPVLTWRPLATPTRPSLGDLRFALGDLELF